MFIATSLPLVAAGWFGIESAAAALKARAMACEENLPASEIGEFVRRWVKELMERQREVLLEAERGSSGRIGANVVQYRA